MSDQPYVNEEPKWYRKAMGFAFSMISGIFCLMALFLLGLASATTLIGEKAEGRPW